MSGGGSRGFSPGWLHSRNILQKEVAEEGREMKEEPRRADRMHPAPRHAQIHFLQRLHPPRPTQPPAPPGIRPPS